MKKLIGAILLVAVLLGILQLIVESPVASAICIFLIIAALVFFGLRIWKKIQAKKKQPEAVKETPSVEVSKPVAEVAKPVAEVAKPVAEVAKPVAEVAKPVAEAAKPVAEAAKPVAEAAKPVAEAAKPVVNNIKSTVTIQSWRYVYDRVGLYQPKGVCVMPEIGDEVEFVEEPDNPYDSQAVYAAVNGENIGYMNRNKIRDFVVDILHSETGEYSAEVTRADTKVEIEIRLNK